METPENSTPEVKAKKKSSWMKGFVLSPPRSIIVPDYKQYKRPTRRLRTSPENQ